MTDTEVLLIIIISVVFIVACVVLAFFYYLDIWEGRFFKWWAKKDAEMKRKFEEELRKEKNRGDTGQQ